MEIEQAIEVLNLYEYSTKLELSEGFRNHIADNITVDEFMQMKELAIKALEKQIPKKPNDISKIYTGEKVGTCICGYDGVLEHEKHCHACGQKLDWEGKP